MRSTIALAAVLLLLLAPQSTAWAKKGYRPIDDLGNVVGVNNPQRIVSLAPNVTEMLFYLGFGSRVVGVSDYCDWPPETAGLSRVGGLVDTSLEAVVALKPDLVIAYQGNSRELVEQLAALKINVFCLNEASSLHEVGHQMSRLDLLIAGAADRDDVYTYLYGGDTDTLNEFVSALKNMTATVRQVKSADLGSSSTFTVFYGYPNEMIYTAGGNTFINDLIERSGGLNCAWRLRGWPSVSAEFLLSVDPTYILTGTSCTTDEDPEEVRTKLIATLQDDDVFGKLAAVEAGRVIVIDADILNRPGPRLLDALMEIYRQLDANDRPAQYELLLEAGY
jgi:iron complex transport system substrate-binding protein